MAQNIDYDRGVHIRKVENLGLDVFMYVDSPGVYLNAHGTPVTSEIAAQAGFPVEEHLKQRRIKERMASAIAKIKEEIDASEGEQKVVNERNGFTIVDIGLGRYQVRDPDGDVLTQAPMSEQEINIVFDQLVPKDEAPAPVLSFAKGKQIDKGEEVKK